MARTDQGLRPEHSLPLRQSVAADALSRKHYCNNLMVQKEQPTLYEELEKLN
jgi:hypothetical protein